MDRHSCRPGWVKPALLLALVALGGAGGILLSGAWQRETSPTGENVQLPAAALPASTQRFPLTALDAKDMVEAPDVAADAAGRVYLTWASKTGEAERTVFVARSLDAGRSFAAPLAVSTGGVYRSGARAGGKGGHERRATPHLAVVGENLQLVWSEAGTDGARMRLLLATSTDAGATFTAPLAVHAADRPNPTFTGLAIGPGGALACTWLGDRDGFQQPFAALRPAKADRFDPERAIHAGGDGKGVCPCCPTAACFAPDGTLYVAYRDIRDGYRDIAVCRLRPGQTAIDGPFAVVPSTWQVDACPHDGPSLAMAQGALHVVWMDAHTGPPRCYHAWATLADMKFTARPLHAAGLGGQGNAKLLADPAGGLHVVWEESLKPAPADAHSGHAPPNLGGASDRAIHYAYRASGQADFGPVRAVAPKAGAYQTRPAITRTPGGDLWVAWNEFDDEGKAIVVTRLPAPTLLAQGSPP